MGNWRPTFSPYPPLSSGFSFLNSGANGSEMGFLILLPSFGDSPPHCALADFFFFSNVPLKRSGQYLFPSPIGASFFWVLSDEWFGLFHPATRTFALFFPFLPPPKAVPFRLNGIRLFSFREKPPPSTSLSERCRQGWTVSVLLSNCFFI